MAASADAGGAGHGAPEGGFGLYLHWPFCTAKCPYCDFNSHVAARVDQGRWAAAFEAEIARVAAEVPGRFLGSIFFGGGTPSLMLPETVERILRAVRGAWRLTNDCEITLEANPGSVEAARFDGYAAAGVNRVSLGLQALNDRDLQRLGRLHSTAEGLAALEIARSRFERVSFDLIYARQDQGVDAWRDELARALDFGTDHLSLYQLTIEPGTAFGARHAAGGLAGLPGEDLAADLWEVTQVLTERAGMPAYEISNHARPGAEGRHNLVYWRGGDYAGIGPGAHGRLTLDGIRHATETLAQPGAWLEAVETRGSGESMRVPMAADEVREERILMGLRLREGLPIDVFGDEIGNKVNDLVGMRMIESKGGSIRLTDRGRPVLNAVLRTLLTG